MENYNNTSTTIETPHHLIQTTPSETISGWRQYQVMPDITYSHDNQIITISGSTYINRSALVAIKGKAKNGKTFFAQATTIALLKGSYMNMCCVSPDTPHTVLLIDTEQGKERTQAMQKRINIALGIPETSDTPNLTMLCVRELPPNERLEQICNAVHDLTPTVTIIDGIRDCVTDFNDVRESMLVINTLLNLSTEYNTAIVVLIHTNKNDNNIRGHLGTEITNKCDTAVEVDKKENIITVTPSTCRDKEFEPFSFKITEDGLTELCSTNITKTSTRSSYQRHKQYILDVLNNSPQHCMQKKDLQKKITATYAVSDKTALRHINQAITEGIINYDGIAITI